MTAEDVRVALQRLLSQVGHWETGRWAAAAGSGGSRGDVVHALVQRLADLGAEAEGRARLPVPREPDMILPDQLKVMVDDLVAAGPAESLLARATEEIGAARSAL
ncbi:hypothetical protein [Actinoplanes sp. RD1]|uniref:hypothetical protein n=1 Tax=Actinoplanes sp. RD1 TaxID=3064538 RepID=UPI0027418C61|nr:hypothetical protein [Actinoplanes sp. RD1]